MAAWVRCSATILAFFLLPRHSEADSKDSQAVAFCERGQYQKGISLVPLGPKATPSAVLAFARCAAYVGRLGEAEASLAKIVKASSQDNSSVSEEARIFLAKQFQETGRNKEAINLLSAQQVSTSPLTRSNHLLASIFILTGQKAKADKLYRKMVAFEQEENVKEEDSEGLFLVAEAGRALGQFQYANETYRDSLRAAAKSSILSKEANIAWGQMFLEKFAPGNAAESFEEVLESNPKHPDALAGMARVRLEESYNISDALKYIRKALAVNSRHQEALIARASIEIDRNQWATAEETLRGVLKVNPGRLEALSLLAAIYWLRDDTRNYQRTKQKVFAKNRQFGKFYHLVGRSAVREHRYESAIDLYKQAVLLNPKDYSAMEAVGTGYLRLAEEKQGLEWLEKAYAGDRYNVRTVNTLELFDDYIPRNYRFAETDHFHLRLHKDEKEILLKTVGPVLEEAYSSMVKKYGFSPSPKTTVELFNSKEHYSVRTIGLPNLGALGVCFGRVITALSPSTGDVNWGMVLWHELAHVFAIQLSNSRVPRWYTEGLSEYETVLARPEWRRENDADIAAALRAGELPSVSELNYGFMKPDRQKVVVAYHLSSATIQYIAETYGFPALVKGLKLFGKGLETEAVIEKITGRTVKAFDSEFRDYLKRRLSPFMKGWEPPSSGYDDVKKLKRAVEKDKANGEKWAALALGHYYSGNAKPAENAAKKSLKIRPKNPIALFVLAEMQLRAGNHTEAKSHFQRLALLGFDSAEIRQRLAHIARQAGDIATAVKHLCTAISMNPEDSYPFGELHELYAENGDEKAALTALESYVFIEQMEFAPVRKLAMGYAKNKNWQKAFTYGNQAIGINPFDAELLLMVGRAGVETKTWAKAAESFELALEAKPPLRRPAKAYVGIGEANIAIGNGVDAKAAIDKALSLEPENKKALTLKAKIDKKRL